MKTKKFLCFILSLVLITGISWLLFFNTQKLDRNFVRIPVSFFPFANLPTIKVKIEGQKYSVQVDSGSSHPIDLFKKDIEKIKNKSFLTETDYINIKGKSFYYKVFKIPTIFIGENCQIEAPLSEENEEFIADAHIWPNQNWPRIKDKICSVIFHGRVGWPLFKQAACLFDFPTSEIVLAKDINTLVHDAGYSFQDFTKIPFNLEKWGIVFTFETDVGAKRFMLDSGATISVLRESLVGKESAKETEPGKWLYKTNKLSTGTHDFGNWSFYLYNFTERFDVDGILGIDFFKKHSICLDFPNRTAYIKAHQSLPDKFVSWIHFNQM